MSGRLLTLLLICTMLFASSVCCCAVASPTAPDGSFSCCAAKNCCPQSSPPEQSRHCPCSKQQATPAAAMRNHQHQASLHAIAIPAMADCHISPAHTSGAGIHGQNQRRQSPGSPSGLRLLQRICVNRC
jgi:hypothetical protein